MTSARFGLGLIVALAAMALAAAGNAQQARVDRLELVESGLFRAEITGTTSAPGTPAGRTEIVDKEAFYDSSSRVAAQLGQQFGVRFRTVGSPDDAPIVLRQIWRLPEPGLRNPASGNVYRESVQDIEAVVGAVRLAGYGFDDPWELVPGDWTLEIWHGERRLLTHTFTVYNP